MPCTLTFGVFSFSKLQCIGRMQGALLDTQERRRASRVFGAQRLTTDNRLTHKTQDPRIS